MTMALTLVKRGKLKGKETRATFHPRQVLDVELSEPLPSLGVKSHPASYHRAGYAEALLLVRLYSYPVAQVMVSLEPPLGSEDLAAELWHSLAPSINTFLKRHGLAPASGLADPQLEALGLSLTAKREAFLSRAPLASVVICTRDRAESLERCLSSVVALEYPRYEIIVVDGAPKSEATRQVVKKFRMAGAPIHYVQGPTSGVAVARNTALKHVKGSFVAYLDDDEVADKYWLLELAQGFERDENVAAVSGVVVPAELESQAQVWFEDLDGHSQGRGFAPESFNRLAHDKQSPLFPLPPFGVAGNMAFKTKAICKIGFDTTLGAGTPALAGEDTAAFFDVLMAGQTVVYQPSAIVRQYHRRDVAGLQAQLQGAGVGLAAFYVRSLRKHPRLAPLLATLVPKILLSIFGPASNYQLTTTTVPKALKTAKRQGFLRGFAAYAKKLEREKPSKG
jgi:glycosyltransferase involved in cell wall biosynthesis